VDVLKAGKVFPQPDVGRVPRQTPWKSLLRPAASIAQEKKLVTARADLTPDRRLQSSGGAARALYAELIGNLATRSTPDGGALPSVRFPGSGSACAGGEDGRVDVGLSGSLKGRCPLAGYSRRVIIREWPPGSSWHRSVC
jgi:hypothetical protein